MGLIETSIKARKLPEILRMEDGRAVTDAKGFEARKAEIREILMREVYGRWPEAPENITMEEIAPPSNRTCTWAGKATQQHYTMSFDTKKRRFQCPFTLIIPQTVEKPPVFVAYCFEEQVPNRYLPMEEIIDAGFAVAALWYNAVSLDEDDDYASGLAPLAVERPRRAEDPGKIALWAYAGCRVLDCLIKDGRVDTDNAAVIGHSRLGKTALLTGAMDERFKFICSNNAGCSGDAITREKKGERVADITRVFPFWFCENYKKYAGEEAQMPFDQHFLLAAIAPRYLCIGAARDDEWADPQSQYLSACTLEPVYALYGRRGLVCPDRMPEPGETFHEGSVGYHLRQGEHFLSRYDWQQYMVFIRAKMSEV